MKLVYAFLALLPLTNALTNALADEPIRFTADVVDEALAEDAILLVHCLASRTGHGWEFDSEAKGPHWLRVKEQNRRLTAVYHADAGKERTTDFGPGASDSACDTLEPAFAGATAPPPSPLAALAPPATSAAAPLASLPPGDLLAAVDDPAPRRTWLWVGAGLAALGGGYLALHARQHRPDYGAIQMN